MAVFVKFNCLARDFSNKVHDWLGSDDTIKAVLTNTLPVVTQTMLSEIVQIPDGNGYLAGGIDVQNTGAQVAATMEMAATDATWTAGPANLGPFRWVVFYNDTSPLKSLIGFYDYGAPLVLLPNETFRIDFPVTAWGTVV